MKNLTVSTVICGMFLLVGAAGGSLSTGRDRDLDGDIDRPCDLICLNGGSCQLSTDAEVAQLGHPSQYCDCREGYGGITCEYVAEQCGFMERGLDDAARDSTPREDGSVPEDEEAPAVPKPEKRYCMHGAPCKMTVDAATKQQVHNCDCSHAIEAGAYAGQSCEHVATSYCRDGKVQRASFCVNGGTCKKGTDSGADGHVGCNCPAAFEGDFCEYEKGLNMTHRYESMEKPKSEVASIVLGAILIALLAGLVFSLFYMMIDGCRQSRRDRTSAALNASTPDLSLDPDGETLKSAGTAQTAPVPEASKIEFA